MHETLLKSPPSEGIVDEFRARSPLAEHQLVCSRAPERTVAVNTVVTGRCRVSETCEGQHSKESWTCWLSAPSQLILKAAGSPC